MHLFNYVLQINIFNYVRKIKHLFNYVLQINIISYLMDFLLYYLTLFPEGITEGKWFLNFLFAKSMFTVCSLRGMGLGFSSLSK